MRFGMKNGEVKGKENIKRELEKKNKERGTEQ